MAQKVRPAVILSVEYQDDERAMVTYVPRTTSIWGTRFEVEHKARNFKTGVFDPQSIGSVPAAKFQRKLANLDAATMANLEGSVRNWLNL